jgi:hypothetical protein
MFIPDPASDFFPSRIRIVSIPDPGSASKNLSILTQNNGFYAVGNMILVVHPGSRIPDPDPDFLPIPDPGVKKAPDPGSGSGTLHYCGKKYTREKVAVSIRMSNAFSVWILRFTVKNHVKKGQFNEYTVPRAGCSI